ncbi:hypothetical protein CU044_6679 [Streptomyces sp. L-9-10]|uniref:hypothetical protein n=1 Tax=unclassified Streptomyces TaxID=2593676 RepID=UPI00101D55CC|nr:hypothetical protein [Streptomyces sp. L-9-10]RYJ21196.1 hypothetical protein CU044_6679 [Streptomyces sp. L-9-10]
MLLLAELLTNFLPGKVKTRGEYVLSAVVMTVLSLLVLSSLGHLFGQTWGTALTWASVVTAGVAVGYAVAYPFVRARLTGTR